MASRRKRKSSKAFTGYFQFPVVPSDESEPVERAMDFYGDFADPVKRNRIMEKPRKYHVEIHMYYEQEEDGKMVSWFDITTLRFSGGKISYEQLADAFGEHAKNAVRDLLEEGNALIDLKKSFYRARIL